MELKERRSTQPINVTRNGVGGTGGAHMRLNTDVEDYEGPSPFSQVAPSAGRKGQSNSSVGMGGKINNNQRGSSNNSQSLASLTIEESIKARLLNLFNSKKGASLTTDQVLFRFGDIKDQFAPIFREQLRKVAVLQDGKWKKR